MSQSRVEIYLHFVWGTYRRMPLIVPEIEQRLYAVMHRQVQEAACEVLALGGMPDHVHLALRLSPAVAPATLIRQVKAVSSTFARNELVADGFFGWQDGYGAFSFGRSDLHRVVAYIRNQKQHHAPGGRLQTEWETTQAPTP